MLTKINDHCYKSGPWFIDQKAHYNLYRIVTWQAWWECRLTSKEALKLDCGRGFYGQGSTPEEALAESRVAVLKYREELALRIASLDALVAEGIEGDL